MAGTADLVTPPEVLNYPTGLLTSQNTSPPVTSLKCVIGHSTSSVTGRSKLFLQMYMIRRGDDAFIDSSITKGYKVDCFEWATKTLKCYQQQSIELGQKNAS